MLVSCRQHSPDLEVGPTEEDAMQIAADLASKSAEARQRESQQVQPVIQVGHRIAQLH